MKRFGYLLTGLLSASFLTVLLLQPRMDHHYSVAMSDIRSIFNLTNLQPDRSWLNVSQTNDSSSCEPKGNLVFIKTHKTGSTTLRNILNRYGLSNNLSFLLNKEQVVGHIMSPSKPTYITDFLPPIGVEVGDYQNYQFNISNIHMRPNWKELRQLMNPSTIYMTILRHPVDQWLSSYQYFHHYKIVEPLRFWEPDPVKAFLKFPAKFKEWSAIVCNQQFRDMEFSMTNGDLNDTSFIRKKIKDYSALFSLVLITEYFDESLILLKRLLCWKFDDILYIKMREQPNPLQADSSSREQIQELNKADMMLYTHFNETFWQMVDEYGPDFEKDLRYFRDHLNAMQEECVGESKVAIVAGNHENIKYKVKAKSEICKSIVNYGYAMEAMKRQQKRATV
ncbi:galactose-3-O-sulfotransferase 2-like [Apostichopus japonicus]|uniref:galactose-3-O-sulfotransferase 2-like n=1 Tax=Stichopus japonicus TaxID=307972 RepID=UPI003AB649DC